MRTHLVATLGIALSVALGAAAGCGADVNPTGTTEDTAVQSDALSIDLPFFTVRRDLRKCMAPHCGGWWLQEANTREAEVYVGRLDFSAARLDDGHEQDVVNAADADVVLRGVIRPDHHGKIPYLAVTAAYLGLPGFARGADDAYYQVRCPGALCEGATAQALDRAVQVPIHGVSIDAVLAPRVSRLWVQDRVEHHGALLAGHMISDGTDLNAAPQRVLVASQVYLSLADLTGPCLLTHRVCAAPYTAAYTRDANLCREFIGCVKPTFCPLFVPACTAGYTLTSWPARQGGCPDFACDPSFLTD